MMVAVIPAESVIHTQASLLLSPSQKHSFTVPLAVGQVLEGKVVRCLSGQRFLMDFMGSKAVAKSMLPLTQGVQIKVKVGQVTPHVVMHIVGEDSSNQKALTFVRTYLSSQISWGDLLKDLSGILTDEKLSLLEVTVDYRLLEKVRDVLSALIFNENKLNDGESIRHFLEQSGLLYESKLKDLLSLMKISPMQLEVLKDRDFKALLMRLSQELEQATEKLREAENPILRGKVATLLKTVTASIKGIELHQLVNYLTERDEEALVLQLPFMVPEGVETAELYIRKFKAHKKRTDHQEDFHIVFLLTMRNLGGIKVDTLWVKRKVSCAIQVESEKVARFVRGNLSELIQRLERLKCTPEKVSCTVKKGKIEKDVTPGGISLLKMKLLDIVA